MSDKLPPQDAAAERAVLGRMFRDSGSICEAGSILARSDFRSYAHALIFEAIVTLADEGVAADPVIVGDRLRAAGKIEDAGGLAYLSELWVEGENHSAGVRHYAEIVRTKSVAYSVLGASRKLGELALDESLGASELIAETERALLEISTNSPVAETVPIRELVHQTYIALDERQQRAEGSIDGLPTGFPELDAMTAGLRPGELSILAARPSVGKTAAAVCIARHVAICEQVPLLFVSLEQNGRELVDRLLCCQAEIGGQRMRTGHLRPRDQERLLNAGDLVSRSRLHIADTPSQTMATITATARRMKRMHGIGLVIVDYLQLVTVDGKRETRQEQIAGISRRLKLLARELQIPVLVLAQLNREVEGRQGQRPKLSDLRESGALEQDADAVFLLHRHDDTIIDLIVAKQRNGPIGDVRLAYVKQQMRFESFGTV